MDKLDIIIRPIKEELETFKVNFRQVFSGHEADFQHMMDYVSNSSGKHIRPILLLLSAKMCGGKTNNNQSIDYSVVLELLHTATLIHDDIVDNTMERRGNPSVNAFFDNKAAVLLGDYVLSLAIIKAVNTKNQQVLEIMGQLAKNLVDGELSQLISSKNHLINEERYFEIIRKKTALLLSSCTEMGAISVDASKETIENLRLIGENLGLIFQIKDDIFDYFDQGEIGKPTGNDIREGKITLPLIYALTHAPKEAVEPMMNILDNQDLDSDNVHRLIDFAKQYGGIEYAESRMQNLKDKTISLMDSFPDSEAKTAFAGLIDYIINRKK